MSAAVSDNDNIVLISGGAAGIGRHIAEVFLNNELIEQGAIRGAVILDLG